MCVKRRRLGPQGFRLRVLSVVVVGQLSEYHPSHLEQEEQEEKMEKKEEEA